MGKTKKKGFFRLSAAQYREYQDERERPRGAFADIWEPDQQPLSLHKVKVEGRAIYLADKGRKPVDKPKQEGRQGLFLRDLA